MGREIDYYRLLGVAPDASVVEIGRAYRRLARRYHPDRNPGRDTAERFRRITRARTVLSDPERRARYDRAHNRQPTPAAARPVLRLRRGVLELSAAEARQAATHGLVLAAAGGVQIALPAGTADGDEIQLDTRDGQTAVLTVLFPTFWDLT